MNQYLLFVLQKYNMKSVVYNLKFQILLILSSTATWQINGASFASHGTFSSKATFSCKTKSSFLSDRIIETNSRTLNDLLPIAHFRQGRQKLSLASLLPDLFVHNGFESLVASTDFIISVQSGALGVFTSLHRAIQASQFVLDSTSTYTGIYLLTSLLADHTVRKKQPISNKVYSPFLLRFEDEFLGINRSDADLKLNPMVSLISSGNEVMNNIPDPDDDDNDLEEERNNDYNDKQYHMEDVVTIKIEEDIIVHSILHDNNDFDCLSTQPRESTRPLATVALDTTTFIEEVDNAIDVSKLAEKRQRDLLKARLEFENRDLFSNSLSDEAYDSEPIVVEDVFICEDSNFSMEECIDSERNNVDCIDDREVYLGDIISSNKFNSVQDTEVDQFNTVSSESNIFFADEVYPDLPMAQGLCDAAFNAELKRIDERSRDENQADIDHRMDVLRSHVIKKGIESKISKRRQAAHAETSNILKKYVEEEKVQSQFSRTRSQLVDVSPTLRRSAKDLENPSSMDKSISSVENHQKESYKKLFSTGLTTERSKGRFKRLQKARNMALDLLPPKSRLPSVGRNIGKVGSDALEAVLPVKTKDVLQLTKKREIVLTSVALVVARRLLRIWVGPLFPF